MMRPQDDTFLQGMKAIALKGGEHGPLYDEGMLLIIRQIEAKGHFVPSIATLLIDRHSNPQIWATSYSPQERAEAEELARLRGWTVEQASQYGRGVQAARIHFKNYQQKEEAGQDQGRT